MTSDVEYYLRKIQNSQDDNLCKKYVQVDIYPKLPLIKLNPVVFLLTAKGSLVFNFKSSMVGNTDYLFFEKKFMIKVY